MPDQYIQAPIETDPSALAEEAFADLQARIPGWVPNEGNLETILIEEGAAMAAEVRDVASDVPATIFRYFGAKLANLPPTFATQATATSTWTAIDDQGYTIDAGTVVGIPATGDELILFEVVQDVIIAPGDTQTEDGEVVLQAQDAGALGGGLGGPDYPLTLVEAPQWVDGALLTDITQGGADDEDDDAYRDRLARELALSSPKIILPQDAAVMATTVPPVDRALAIDLFKPGPPYDPDPAAIGVARTMTVAVQDAQGQPVPNRQAVFDLLASLTIANGLIYVIDPTYTAIDVTFAAIAYPNFDPADVLARAITALTEYFDPANWGTIPAAEARLWINQDHAYLSEVFAALNNVDGLWRVTSLTLGKNGGGQSSDDVLLDGIAPLSQAGSIIGSVDPA